MAMQNDSLKRQLKAHEEKAAAHLESKDKLEAQVKELMASRLNAAELELAKTNAIEKEKIKGAVYTFVGVLVFGVLMCAGFLF